MSHKYVKTTTFIVDALQLQLMSMLDHPFIVNLIATFKDKDCLYFLEEFVCGGELYSLVAMCRNCVLPENDVKFYTACILQAFKHMHSKCVVYRNLKSENLLIDDKGYLKVLLLFYLFDTFHNLRHLRSL